MAIQDEVDCCSRFPTSDRLLWSFSKRRSGSSRFSKGYGPQDLTSALRADGGPATKRQRLTDSAENLPNGKTLPVAIVLDIEGTVAPISFVASRLFPYARQHLRPLITHHIAAAGWDRAIACHVTQLCAEVCHLTFINMENPCNGVWEHTAHIRLTPSQYVILHSGILPYTK